MDSSSLTRDPQGDQLDLLALAQQVAAGDISPERFVDLLGSNRGSISTQASPLTIDVDRSQRCGFPEVIYAPGKSHEQLVEAVVTLLQHDQPVLATRVGSEAAGGLATRFPEGRYNAVARTFRLDASRPIEHAKAHVAVISAGTGDLPVAEEARETLGWMGVRVTAIHDVGVAGPHRLAARVRDFADADAIVVVAGMEGALPSVVGGYVACPVIAVPTSIGYGANFGGVSALLSMLNSCAANVAVVNIDAGFKGAYLAGMIAARRHASQAPDFGQP